MANPVAASATAPRLAAPLPTAPLTAPLPTDDLLRRHVACVRRLALALLGDADAADDVVQDTWLRAVQRPPRRAEAMSAWLARVARNLLPGRFRASDPFSDAVSDELDVVAGGGRRELVLDLRAVVDVAGQVVVPPGEDARRAFLEVDGEARQVAFDADGRFRLRLSLDRARRVQACHPGLIADPAHGSTELMRKDQDLVLHLVRRQ